MSYVYRRPMFRKGGSAGEGITSGFQSLEKYISPKWDPYKNYTAGDKSPVGAIDPSTGEINMFEFQEEADLRHIISENQELLNILSALKEIE